MRNETSDRGAAMITAVLGLLIVTTLTVAVVAVVTGDLNLSRHNANQVAVQFAAESGAEIIYEELVYNPNLFRTPDGGGDPDYASLISWVGEDPDAEAWVTFTDGFVTPCPDPGAQVDPCWHFDATIDNPADPRVVSVEVTAEGYCVNGTCLRERVRQTLRKRGFLDHLIFTDREALDPDLESPSDPTLCDAPTSVRIALEKAVDDSGVPGDFCKTPAYHAPDDGNDGDQIEGDVWTNDDSVAVCGQVQFEGNLTVVGTGGAYSTNAVGVACEGSSINFIDGTGDVVSSPLALPCNYREAETCVALAGLRPIADASGSAFNADTVITILAAPFGATASPIRVSVGGGPEQDIPMPDTGVIHVTGNATIRTEAPNWKIQGRLTLAATGDITIDTDLVLNDTDRDMLGLVAGRSVLVTPVGFGEVRTVHAGILALGGSFYSPGWQSAPPSTLNLFGAVAAKWRGAIGQFDDLSGALKFGYRKNWVQDHRFSSEQPPFFLQPAAAGWARVDLTVVPSRT